jgi:polar amino acid transport system substrate-binding protein
MHRRCGGVPVWRRFMNRTRRLALLPIAALVLAACQNGTGDGSPAPTDDANGNGTVDVSNVICVGEATTYLDWIEGTLAIDEQDPIEQPADMDDPEDLLNIVRDRGTLIVSTDPNYAPQSFLNPDGSFEGFDIDVATEIAERLGVEIQFETPEWDAITAGNWAERWDISVGSMTITEGRKEILSFTQPYYYTPAQLAASEASGVTSPDQLPFDLPDGAEATTLPTDANCGEAIQAGREEFVLWMSAAQTIQEGIDAGVPVVMIGEPYFGEPLAVAIDKSGPSHEALLYEIDRIIGEMHEDGTLTELSEQWYDGLDLTQVAD